MFVFFLLQQEEFFDNFLDDLLQKLSKNSSCCERNKHCKFFNGKSCAVLLLNFWGQKKLCSNNFIQRFERFLRKELAETLNWGKKTLQKVFVSLRSENVCQTIMRLLLNILTGFASASASASASALAPTEAARPNRRAAEKKEICFIFLSLFVR